MIGKTKLTAVVLLVYVLLAGACNRSEKTDKYKGPQQAGEVKTMPAEKRKAKLLKKIDRKYTEAETHFELGQLYQAEGRWPEAEREYGIAAQFDPVDWRARAGRIKMLMAVGDQNKAELLADEYMTRASNRAEWALRLGLAFQKQQLDEYALNCYQRALTLAPNSAKINRQIGYYYLSKGDKVQAKNYLTRSFQLDKNQPEVSYQLGRMGTAVQIPRKTKRGTKRLDKIVEESDKERTR